MTPRTQPSHGTAAETLPQEAVRVMYELLDAHADTAELVGGLAADDDLRLQAHLDYLRALQRVGRELLAQMSSRERS